MKLAFQQRKRICSTRQRPSHVRHPRPKGLGNAVRRGNGARSQSSRPHRPRPARTVKPVRPGAPAPQKAGPGRLGAPAPGRPSAPPRLRPGRVDGAVPGHRRERHRAGRVFARKAHRPGRPLVDDHLFRRAARRNTPDRVLDGRAASPEAKPSASFTAARHRSASSRMTSGPPGDGLGSWPASAARTCWREGRCSSSARCCGAGPRAPAEPGEPTRSKIVRK